MRENGAGRRGACCAAVALALVLQGACSYGNALEFGSSVGLDGGGPSEVPSTCVNAQQDPGESDVDCGGGGCQPCAVGKHCSNPAHCASKACAGNDETGATCQAPSFHDGVQNGSETGVDCGGSTDAPKCPIGQPCRQASDCQHAVCADHACSTPGATDGVKNGFETDVDCGGPDAPKCVDGKDCAAPTDCASGACNVDYLECTPVSAADGVLNGDESDVDCGGGQAGVPRCRPGKACRIGTDCSSKVCIGGLCQNPTGIDGVKNGDESDVDCGGSNTGAAPCGPGKACLAMRDCTMGCGYEGACLPSRSCTRHYGGDTCGPGETPAQGKGAQHESCCAQGQPFAAGGQTVLLDSYLYTAGRMRAMIEQLDGKLKTWMTNNRPGWFDAAWLAYLPDNKFDAEQGVGPYGVTPRRGCSFSDTGRTSARTYDTDSRIDGSDGEWDRATEIPRSLLDEKPLNCVTWPIAAAACAYDGRRLASTEAINAAVAGPDGRKNPWGTSPVLWDGSSETNAGAAADLTAGFYSSYLNAGASGTFIYRWPQNAVLENSRGIPAPGRMYRSLGAFGQYDLYGPMLVWTDGPLSNFMHTYSWEGHGRTAGSSVYTQEAYHAIGFRCMQVL